MRVPGRGLLPALHIPPKNCELNRNFSEICYRMFYLFMQSRLYLSRAITADLHLGDVLSATARERDAC